MITARHIEIYKKYGGDVDGFSRFATKDQQAIMDYKDWSLIAGLIQDLVIIKSGLASVSFIKATDEKLKESCDNDETIWVMKKFSMADRSAE